MSLLLDTVAVSEFRKIPLGRANPTFAAWARTADGAEMHLSVVSVQELEFGIRRLEQRDRARAETMRSWLVAQVIPAFSDRVIGIDVAIARRAASLHVPRTRPALDALIAATALVRGLAVVTRNERDFVGAGVAVINPWIEPVA